MSMEWLLHQLRSLKRWAIVGSMVNGLSGHFDHSKVLYTVLVAFTLSHTFTQGKCVQFLAQGHLDLQTGGAGNRTASALPPEPQFSLCPHLLRKQKHWREGASWVVHVPLFSFLCRHKIIDICHYNDWENVPTKFQRIINQMNFECHIELI